MKVYVNTANKGVLNLRTAPQVKSPVLVQIPYGTTLETNSITEEWSKVTYSGKTGYVMSKFLSATDSHVTKEDLQRIYNSLKSTLQTIESALK